MTALTSRWRRRIWQTARTASGMSLIELIVAMGISLIVLIAAGAIFIGSWKANAQTSDRDGANGVAQALSLSIQNTIRNSVSFNVSGNLLRAVVATGTSGWHCEAWAYKPVSGATGTVVHTQSSTTIPADATGQYAGWATLAQGVTGALTGGAAFLNDSSDANLLRIGYTITNGTATVPISGGATTQVVGTVGVPTCW